MYILGISAYYHDSAAALVKDGVIIAAAQEERFSRRRHDPGFPHQAIRYCLDAGGIAARELAQVAFYDKPFLKFERLLESYLACAPRGFSSFRMAMPVWLREKLFLRGLLQKEMRKLDRQVKWNERLLFGEHHLSHAASAFFPSPFDEAVVLTLDAVGEWATTSVAIGRGRELEITKEIHFPHSLGMLYSAFTYHTGFKVNSGEYKLMGLAPYGTPRFADKIYQHLIDLKADGSYRLNLEYFDYCVGLRMTNGKFDELFGGRPRQPDEPIEQRHMDMAASIQKVTEEVVLRMVRTLADETKMSNLCLAGGVALNCVVNGKILEEGSFRHIWIQPAAGDAGGAIGAALLAYHAHAKGERQAPLGGDGMNGALLGPEFSQKEIEAALTAAGANYRRLPEAELLAACARYMAEGKALGWVQGRMEFGPRALGARSILADARSPEMQKTLNLKVKYRESFRPFAPAVLAEDAAEWFKLEGSSPYMLLVAAVADRHLVSAPEGAGRPTGLAALAVPRSTIPAVTHVDLSARVQTVDREQHPKFHALISEFKRLTACPVLVNTSFNVRGEPIVCTPEDAYRCFMGSGIEVLAIGNCLLLKEDQPPRPEMENYHEEFEAD
jgi:carbamoyltransferase